MKNEIILWICSLVIVFLLGYFKNVTDKDYPITGTFGIDGKKVSYKLDKISHDKTAYKNIVICDIEELEGNMIWMADSVLLKTPFEKIKGGMKCEIPSLKPGKKINYKIILTFKEKTFIIPKDGFITLTFWGNIPSGVSLLYFILLYGGLLMSLRCMFELFNENKNLKKFAVITCSLFLTLNSIVIPLRNSYKLGAINSFVPPVAHLIQPALLTILFLWIIGTVFLFYKKYSRVTIAIMMSATVILFFMS